MASVLHQLPGSWETQVFTQLILSQDEPDTSNKKIKHPVTGATGTGSAGRLPGENSGSTSHQHSELGELLCPLCLSFLICSMDIMPAPTSQGYCED